MILKIGAIIVLLVGIIIYFRDNKNDAILGLMFVIISYLMLIKSLLYDIIDKIS